MKCPNVTSIVGVTGTHVKCGTTLVWPIVGHEEIVLCDACIANAEWVKGAQNSLPNCIPSQSFDTEAI